MMLLLLYLLLNLATLLRQNLMRLSIGKNRGSKRKAFEPHGESEETKRVMPGHFIIFRADPKQNHGVPIFVLKVLELRETCWWCEWWEPCHSYNWTRGKWRRSMVNNKPWKTEWSMAEGYMAAFFTHDRLFDSGMKIRKGPLRFLSDDQFIEFDLSHGDRNVRARTALC